MIRSGDRIPTGTGAARRRLTQAEAEAGGVPEPFTDVEWAAMYGTSRVLHNRCIVSAYASIYPTHPKDTQVITIGRP